MEQLHKLLTLAAVGSLLFTGAANAGLSITNGDMEANAPADNVSDVEGWYDRNTATSGDVQGDAGDWWASTWYGPTVSPNGTSVMGLSRHEGDGHWAYQDIGVNDGGLTSLPLQFDIGSFTDAGGPRDIGVEVSVYQSDGTFAPADDLDIVGGAGITLIGSAMTNALLDPGTFSTVQVSVDISSANTTDNLFLRLVNFDAGEGDPWGAVDNLSIVPEPTTFGLMFVGGLLALNQRRQRR